MRRICKALIMMVLAVMAGEGAVRVTCLGNSITAGRYPTFLQWDVGGVFTVQNAGVPTTTLTYAGENPWIATGMLDSIDRFGPDIVYIKLGTNDSKAITWDTHSDEFTGDYCRLIDTLRALCPGVRVTACLPTPAWTNSGGIRGDVIENEILPAIRQAAQMRGVPVVDLHTPFIGKNALFPDGFHPSDSGAWEISRLVAAELRRQYGVAPDLVSGGTLSASSFTTAAAAPASAADNNPWTAWQADNAGAKWLQVTFPQAVTVDRWEVVHAWNQQPARITRDFRLQASDNGTDWRDIDIVSGSTAVWTARDITASSSRYFRLYITYGSMFGPAWICGFVLRNAAGTVDIAQPSPGHTAFLSAPVTIDFAGPFDVSGRRMTPTRTADACIVITKEGVRTLAPTGVR